jgi:TolB-like protein/Tfp pilus assembly protein PilF
VAEVGDIADVPAPLRASSCLEARIVAIAIDQIGRVGKRQATVDEGRFHANTLNPHPVSRLPTNVVNRSLTMLHGAQGAGRMSDVFVSYKAEDRRRVQPLVEALQADGLSAWWDAQIGGGDSWRESIEQQLEAARCVMVIWSKRSVGHEGHFVRDEAARAQRKHTYLPVLIDKVEPPLGFGESQAISLIGWRGDRSDARYVAALEAVRSIIAGRPFELHVLPPMPQTISRRGVIAGGAVAAAVAAGAGWLLMQDKAEANSIAVLPFANLSGDPAQTYFSDGMAEELRSALSRIGRLKVVARTSSEMLRNADAKTAADKLGVANILTGSVRRSPSTIRVSAQLIDGDNGMERWSESFDRPIGDVLLIQTGIAESVAQALSIRLAGDNRAVLEVGGTRNPAAQDLYFRSSPERLNDSEANEALRLLNQAIALDPNFAKAHARKGEVLRIKANVYSLSLAEGQRENREALASANRAIAIAPRLAEGYAARANILREQLNLGGALADLKKADALPGNDVATLRAYANLLGQSGRHEEALMMAERATSLDPLNPVSLEVQAYVLYRARRYTEAAAVALRSLQIAPDRPTARRILANALLWLNKNAEADAEYRKLEPTHYYRLLGEAVLAARAGDRERALKHLGSMQRRYGDAALYQYGEIYAQLGDADRAFKDLELAWNARDPGLAGIRVDPFLDPIRRDPRFATIEAKLNFPRT